MKKIKILFGLILLLIFSYTLGIIQSITQPNVYKIMAEARQSDIVFGEYSFLMGKILTVFIFAGLIISLKCIYEILKKGFFTAVSKKLMRNAGYIFLFVGIISGVLDIINLFAGSLSNQTQALINDIIIWLTIGLLGFIILIIADMAQTGYLLKSENDLTI